MCVKLKALHIVTVQPWVIFAMVAIRAVVQLPPLEHVRVCRRILPALEGIMQMPTTTGSCNVLHCHHPRHRLLLVRRPARVRRLHPVYHCRRPKVRLSLHPMAQVIWCANRAGWLRADKGATWAVDSVTYGALTGYSFKSPLGQYLTWNSNGDAYCNGTSVGSAQVFSIYASSTTWTISNLAGAWLDSASNGTIFFDSNQSAYWNVIT